MEKCPLLELFVYSLVTYKWLRAFSLLQQVKVLIIGSGFGGQSAAINLLNNDISDFVILERRPFMGGTWCQNTYPGAAVDVQSPLYSLSFEPYDWSQMFANQSELKTYTEHVIDKYELANRTQLNSPVDKIAWCDKQQHWQVDIVGQPSILAQFIINASGPLSTPVIPNFKGKERFKGKSFHTNDWDHDFDYTNKNVAIIGSGASAAQIIPAIAEDVNHLHVFQRTPHWVIPRGDYTFKPWQRKLLRKPWAYKLLRRLIYWALEFRVVGFKYSQLALKLLAQNKAERLINKQISDPDLKAKVTPDYIIGCKRVILSNTLYPAYGRDNVTLHDKSQGIKEICETGVITKNDQTIDVDLIVYSTGYDATDGVISYPVIGKGGVTLASFWHKFPRAYLGTAIPDFPNLFIVTGPNTGIGHTSALFVIEAQMNYIMSSINAVKKKKMKAVSVKASAEKKYTQHIHQEMDKTVWKSGGCDSWYRSKSGHVVAMFPGFSFTYQRWAKNFRESEHEFS
jgi:cation diffusion facilitator CzcD-associated flavoprotein CzcO